MDAIILYHNKKFITNKQHEYHVIEIEDMGYFYRGRGYSIDSDSKMPLPTLLFHKQHIEEIIEII